MDTPKYIVCVWQRPTAISQGDRFPKNPTLAHATRRIGTATDKGNAKRLIRTALHTEPEKPGCSLLVYATDATTGKRVAL
jgi:hypothetical protein